MRSESRRDTACSRPPGGSGGNVCLEIFNPNKTEAHSSWSDVQPQLPVPERFLFSWRLDPCDLWPPTLPRHWEQQDCEISKRFVRIFIDISHVTVTSPLLIGSSLVFSVFTFFFASPLLFSGPSLLSPSCFLFRHVSSSKKQKNKKKNRKGKTRHVLLSTLSDLLLSCCSKAVKKLWQHK